MDIKQGIKNVVKALTGTEPQGENIKDVLKSTGYLFSDTQIDGDTITEVLNNTAIAVDRKFTNVYLDIYMGTDDLLGKRAMDLTTGGSASTYGGGGLIKAYLKYVTGYTGFSSNVEEQSGYYLPVIASGIDGATFILEIIGGTHGPVTLDADKICICRLTSNEQKISITATLGEESATRIYSLDCTFEEQPEPPEPVETLTPFELNQSVAGVKIQVERSTTDLDTFLNAYTTESVVGDKLIDGDETCQVGVIKSFGEEPMWNDFVLYVGAGNHMFFYSRTEQEAQVGAETTTTIPQGWSEIDTGTVTFTSISTNQDITLAEVIQIMSYDDKIDAINGVYFGAVTPNQEQE